jgi:hypothetical protein
VSSDLATTTGQLLRLLAYNSGSTFDRVIPRDIP